MKKEIELHIPTEQYGFVLVKVGDVDAETAAGVYRDYANAFKVNAGIPDKDFDAFIEKQLEGRPNNVEEYHRMSPTQQLLVQCNKRAQNRINYRVTKVNKEMDKGNNI